MNGKPSLLDFLGKNSKNPLIGNTTTENEDTIPFIEQAALVTHYLKLKHSDVKLPYANKAEKLFNQWVEIIDNSQQKVDTCACIISEPHVGYQRNLFSEIDETPFPAPKNPKFTFIDLFAGIGGFRIAMQNLGGECVFSSEWDENARKTYYANFGEIPFGDITTNETKSYIPDNFDVLCAGFPCQAFSIAGYRKGFEDTRGTLFFDIAQILKDHKPKALFLENVKNLKTHDNGNTFKVIEQTLKDLGYCIFHTVLNSMTHANIPQNRERIFIVGFDPKQVPNYINFSFPNAIRLQKTIHNCINYDEIDNSLFYSENHKYYPMLKNAMVNNNTIYQWRRIYVRENQSNVCPTLTANMGEGGHNVPLIITPNGFRKLTPKECLNFQGYPANYIFPKIAQSKKYKQAGNSVTIPLIQRIAENILQVL